MVLQLTISSTDSNYYHYMYTFADAPWFYPQTAYQIVVRVLVGQPHWAMQGAEADLPNSPPRDLVLGRRCTQHYTCNALSGHSLSVLLGGVPVNPRC